jgi:hypothetical protein
MLMTSVTWPWPHLIMLGSTGQFKEEHNMAILVKWGYIHAWDPLVICFPKTWWFINERRKWIMGEEGNPNMEKSPKTSQFGWANIVLAHPWYFDSLLRLVKKYSKSCAPVREKSAINMIWLLVPVCDWPIIMISPSGLLLVVSHVFAVSVSVPWVGVAKG